MHATGKLQLGKESPIFDIMQSYLPGMPLLSYFFTAFRSEFEEGALFVGYACTAMAFLIPTLSKTEWKHSRMLAPFGMLLLLTPIVFTSHFSDSALFGMTLFVDPLLGIVAGFVFYLAGHRPLRTWFDTLAFSLGIGMLCLLKNTGVLFAAAALVCTVVMYYKEKPVRFALPVLALSLTAGGWRILLNLHHVQDSSGSKLQLHTLSGQTVQDVLRALVSRNVIAYRVPLGFLLSFASIFTIVAVLYILAARIQRQKWAAVLIGIAASTAAFIYGYALIYGDELLSFERYMSTPLLCLFTCTLLCGLPSFIDGALWHWAQRIPGAWVKIIGCGCTILSVAVFAIWCMVFPSFSVREELDMQAAAIKAAVEQSVEEGEQAWIYLVIAGDGWDNSHIHHRIFFDLISDRINIRNGLAETRVVEPEIENPTQKWAEDLLSGSNFVYLLSVEDAFIPVFRALSQDEPEAGALYRVVPADNPYGVNLVKQ